MSKKKKRSSYLRDFRQDEAGTYRYEGDRYELEGENRAGGARRILRTQAVLAALAAALLLGAGCVPAPGISGCAYVLLPYIASLMGAVSSCLAAFRLAAAEYPVRAYVYEGAAGKLPVRSGLCAGASAAALVGEAVWILTEGMSGKAGYTALYCLLQGAALLDALCLCRFARQLGWRKIHG